MRNAIRTRRTFHAGLAGVLVAVLGTVAPAGLAAGAVRATKARKTQRAPKPTPPPEPVLTAETANAARPVFPLPASAGGPAVLRMQVLLDRARFSVGEIDGRNGGNTRAALAAYKRANGLGGGDQLDEATWAALTRDAAPVVVPYTITPEDVAGPFYEVPEDMMEKARLPALAYGSALEALAERFHASPRLLAALNQRPPAPLPTGNAAAAPSATAAAVFGQAGAQIQVPNVARTALPAKADTVVVDGTDLSVTVLDPKGNVLARYPATVGSEHDPLPVGEHKINGVGWDPAFKYNPDLFWDADPEHAKAQLPPGPNSPVGRVWIDLSKPHYGIHGTAEPSTIGKTTSHGCIRLTNWDAVELAQLVSPGTRATLRR